MIVNFIFKKVGINNSTQVPLGVMTEQIINDKFSTEQFEGERMEKIIGGGSGIVNTSVSTSDFSDHLSRAIDFCVRDGGLISVRTDGLPGGKKLGYGVKDILKQLIGDRVKERANNLDIGRVWQTLISIQGQVMGGGEILGGASKFEVVSEELHQPTVIDLSQIGYKGFHVLSEEIDPEYWCTKVQLEDTQISNTVKTNRKSQEELADSVQYLRAQKAEVTYSRLHQADSEVWQLRRVQFNSMSSWGERYYSNMLDVLGLMRGVYLNRGIGKWLQFDAEKCRSSRLSLTAADYKNESSKKVLFLGESDLLNLNCSSGGYRTGPFKDGRGVEGFYSPGVGFEKAGRHITWVMSDDLHNPAYVAGLCDLLLRGDKRFRNGSDWSGRVRFDFDELVFVCLGRAMGRLTIGDGVEVVEGRWYNPTTIIESLWSGGGFVDKGGSPLWKSLDYRQAMAFWSGNMIQFTRSNTRVEETLDLSIPQTATVVQEPTDATHVPAEDPKTHAKHGHVAETAEKSGVLVNGKGRRMYKWWEFMARRDWTKEDSSSNVMVSYSDVWVRWAVATGYLRVVGDEFSNSACVGGERLIEGARAMAGAYGAVLDMIAQAAGIPMSGRCKDARMEAGKLMIAAQMGQVAASCLIGGYNDGAAYTSLAGNAFNATAVPSGWSPIVSGDADEAFSRHFIEDNNVQSWFVCMRAWWPLACSGCWYQTDRATVRSSDFVIRDGLESDGLKMSSGGMLKVESQKVLLSDPFLSAIHVGAGSGAYGLESHLYADFIGAGDRRAIVGPSIQSADGRFAHAVPCLLPAKSHGRDLVYGVKDLSDNTTKVRLARMRDLSIVVRNTGWYSQTSTIRYYADADMDFF